MLVTGTKVRLVIKLDVPNWMFGLEWTPLFSWCIFECESKNGHHHVLDRDWTMCSRFINHFRCNIQHNWGGGLLYDRLIIQEGLHFINDLDVHMSSENYNESGHRHDLELLVILH